MIDAGADGGNALTGVRVLDLAQPGGQYCGKLLADLGATVIKVEPRQGDRARRFGPFKNNSPDPEGSLFFAYYNTNKQSLAMDTAGAEGREIFSRLVRWADVVVETPDCPAIAGVDTSYAALTRVNPQVVLVSLLGFAPGGPYSAFRSSSLVAFALSGVMKAIGPPEGPPSLPPGQIMLDLTAVDAASGAVSALLMRVGSGRGQHVWVSAHEVLAAEVNPRPPEQFIEKRQDGSSNPSLAPSGTYACLDGQVAITVNLTGQWRGLKELLGHPPEVEGPEWDDRSYRQAHVGFLTGVVARSVAARPLADLVAQGQRLHVPCGPVNTVASFLADGHLAARGYFVEAQGALGQARMPGAPYRWSEGGWSLRHPAPRLGQQSRAILRQDLGYASAEVDALVARGIVLDDPRGAGAPTGPAPAAADPAPRSSPTGTRPSPPPAADRQAGLPLRGVRVVAFTTAYAGPTAARYLADLGAEVIKVESRRRWDNTRHASQAGVTSAIEPSGAPTAPGFGYFNRNQLGVSVDLSQAKGRELMLRLIKMSDVVVENFSLRVLQDWGFSYERLQAERPELILLDMQGFGQTGPLRDYTSFGAILHAYSGLQSLWGCGHGFFVDFVAAQHAALAVLAALLYRRRTGRGVHIDLAQLETAGVMLGVPCLDFSVNGLIPRGGDGRLFQDAPVGCFPCRQEDTWCVIEVTSDDDWRQLCQVLGHPAWTQDPRLATREGRLSCRSEINSHLAAWTRGLADHEAQDLLQRAGVPAARVLSAREVFDDPQLNATGFYETIDHPVLGSWRYPRLTIHGGDGPQQPARPAPLLGQHNDFVFGQLLGLSAAEIDQLTAEGVLT